MKRMLLSAFIAGLPVAGVLAQQPAPAFEVASVRPTGSTLRDTPFLRTRIGVRPGGRFTATTTAQVLIEHAYNLKGFQIAGGPEWIRRDGFQVDARAPEPDATADDIRAMLRTLLEERFRLVAHTERRDMEHQALVLLNSPDRLGPYLRYFDGPNCPREAVESARKAFSTRAEVRYSSYLSGSCMDVSQFLDMVASMSGLPLVNETGLMGAFAFDLRYGSGASATAGAPGGPTLPVALEEQLGLKLESRRGPVDVLVIDSVQQPTEN